MFPIQYSNWIDNGEILKFIIAFSVSNDRIAIRENYFLIEAAMCANFNGSIEQSVSVKDRN